MKFYTCQDREQFPTELLLPGVVVGRGFPGLGLVPGLPRGYGRGRGAAAPLVLGRTAVGDPRGAVQVWGGGAGGWGPPAAGFAAHGQAGGAPLVRSPGCISWTRSPEAS